MARVSKVIQPLSCPSQQVFSDQVVVFPYDDNFHFGLLSSAFHWHWTLKYASTLETRVRYTPSDVFETFPQPPLSESVEAIGGALDEHRRELMIANDEGLTRTYNRVHNETDTSPGIAKLRELHRDLDLAVRDAYGWDDLALDHGFHPTTQGTRWTVSPPARDELLDRLLELNHQRHAEEELSGTVRKKKSKRASRKSRSPTNDQANLFQAEGNDQ